MATAAYLINACAHNSPQHVAGAFDECARFLNLNPDVYDDCIRAAAQHGRVDILKYMHDTLGITSNVVAFGHACAYEQNAVLAYVMPQLSNRSMRVAWAAAYSAACAISNFHVIKWIVEKGSYALADVWDSGIANLSTRGEYKIVRYLLGKCDRISINWNVLLYNACEAGSLKLIRLIIRAHQDFHLTAFNKPIINACKHGNLDVLIYLLHYPIYTQDVMVWDDAMCAACGGGNLELVIWFHHYISKHGFQFVISNLDNLRNACTNGHIHIVKYLLRYMADPPWDHLMEDACMGGHIHIAQYLFERSAIPLSPDCLMLAVINCHIDVARFILERGVKMPLDDLIANVNVKNLYTLLELGIPIQRFENTSVADEVARIKAARTLKYDTLLTHTTFAEVLLNIILEYTGF
jgi:hypothetical protein